MNGTQETGKAMERMAGFLDLVCSLAGNIIRTARSVVMKLYENYPYREIYEKGMPIFCKLKEIMLKLIEFLYNHHLSGVKMLAKFTRRRFSVISIMKSRERRK